MALVVADRVQETTNTTGTGTLTLAGAVAGFRSFATIGNANTTYYTIVSGTDWEVGLGTYTSVGTTLSRDTVLSSSAGGTTKITVAAGATVFCGYPAGKSVYSDGSGNVSGYAITAGSINNTPIGGTTANTGAFTTLSASSTVSGTGFSTYLASPPAIGGTAANTGAFTTLTLTNPLALGQGGTGQTTAPAASAALMGFTSTATAGGTTTLNNTSSAYQVFTGTSAQTVQLPATSTLATGWSFHIVNNSTKILTVQTSTAVVLDALSPGSTLMPTVLSTAGNTAADWEVGYTDLSTDTRQIPQNAQTGNYTLDTTDIGKHIYHASGAGAAVYTIPSNASVPFEIGTTITFINLSTTAPTIAITTDTMYLAGTGTTGTRTLAQYGVATAIKITATDWIISGSGLT